MHDETNSVNDAISCYKAAVQFIVFFVINWTYRSCTGIRQIWLEILPELDLAGFLQMARFCAGAEILLFDVHAVPRSFLRPYGKDTVTLLLFAVMMIAWVMGALIRCDLLQQLRMRVRIAASRLSWNRSWTSSITNHWTASWLSLQRMETSSSYQRTQKNTLVWRR